MRLTVSVQVGQKQLSIEFNERVLDSKMLAFTTDNTEWQEAIENSNSFGSYYWADPSNQSSESINKEQDEEIVYLDVEVETISDAKEYLFKTFGITKQSVRDLDAVMKKGKANKINFIIKKTS